MSSRLVPIAEIARAHGILGELRLKLYNEDTDLIAKGRRVSLLSASKVAVAATEPSQKTIVSVRPTSGALLIRLDGVTDRDTAEAMRGMQICVDRDVLPSLDDGEFYACDVEGARVVLADGNTVGIVTEYRTYPTCSVLVVAKADGKGELEVPLVEDYVANVDIEGRLVTLHHIDEL